MRNTFVFVLAAMAIAMIPLASAQYGYGTSTVSVTNASVTVHPGHSVLVGYTVTLVSGNTWGTTTNVANKNQLAADGITAQPSTTYGDPTYSGTLTISASSSTVGGTYMVELNATGDDPSTNTATVMVIVPSPAASPTISNTTASTSAPTTAAASSAPTSTIKSASPVTSTGQNYTGYEIAAVVVVIVIVVAAFLALRKR
ncbi:hypothetical protein M1329_01570 [Candidatus Marsarchaeota archaeon]|jgi:hypothetical protein|nr:hypothetical protein [Candidatus Marsarchaeota archaeon]MCL5100027.1 hypothetical protein [Candidatus Marsarchaeota archaeon]